MEIQHNYIICSDVALMSNNGITYTLFIEIISLVLGHTEFVPAFTFDYIVMPDTRISVR